MYNAPGRAVAANPDMDTHVLTEKIRQCALSEDAHGTVYLVKADTKSGGVSSRSCPTRKERMRVPTVCRDCVFFWGELRASAGATSKAWGP